MPTIKCIGQFTVDDLVFPDGTVRMQTMGGNSLYSAAGANLWSPPGTVGAVARVGHDYPKQFVEYLKKCGFDTSFLKSTDREHMRAWLIYEENNERRSLCRNKDVLPYPPTSSTSFEQYLTAYRQLHLQNSPLLEDLSVEKQFADAYHLAPQTGQRHLDNLKAIRKINPTAVVSLDPSPFYMYKGNNKEFAEIVSMTDIIMPSKEEIFSFFGRITPEQAAVELTDLGPAVAVLKMGSAGSYIYSKVTGCGQYCAICQVDAVDFTGAGDSFCGGFLAGYLQSNDLFYAACCGAVSASYGISDYGPSALLQADHRQANERLQKLLKSASY